MGWDTVNFSHTPKIFTISSTQCTKKHINLNLLKDGIEISFQSQIIFLTSEEQIVLKVYTKKIKIKDVFFLV